MLLRLDPTDNRPIYLQIYGSILGAIDSGRMGPGERLPVARRLAASLGVNMHTVLKAYQMLREDGRIEIRRGRGATVIGGVDSGWEQVISHAIRLAKAVEVPKDEFVRRIEQEW
jgi:DNA-binding transcriptional regulator YhcF (GntR family)